MVLNGTLSEHQIDALSYVYMAFLTPSLIGSFSVLVVSICKWWHLQEQVHLLVQLALADLLAALILMYTSVMNKVYNDHGVEICEYSLPLSLTFYTTSFLLVVVYAWKSKNGIQGWRERATDDEAVQSHCRRKIVAFPVYAVVWLIPLAMYLAYVLTPFMKSALLVPATDKSLVQDSIDNERTYCSSCLLFLHVWKDSCSGPEEFHDTFIRVFLFVVVIPVMIFCSVIYYKVGKWYERHEQVGFFPVEGDGRSRRRFKTVYSTARKMVMVILACWTPALVLILLSTLTIWTSIKQRDLFFLYILQAACVSIQGFANSMVYAWRRPNFTDAVLGEYTPLIQNPLPFFDESLRASS
ncbi:transmembrane protein 116 [Stegastes partitus]|uniref:Transmembrane protein 116 n=2 Tax=Stegastes partitus TaxID=144197 RepID=A0A9Y4KHL5_9TELE|nr:PREDICTED: transmembrane protein 116-like [Stegastes partitus]